MDQKKIRLSLWPNVRWVEELGVRLWRTQPHWLPRHWVYRFLWRPGAVHDPLPRVGRNNHKLSSCRHLLVHHLHQNQVLLPIRSQLRCLHSAAGVLVSHSGGGCRSILHVRYAHWRSLFKGFFYNSWSRPTAQDLQFMISLYTIQWSNKPINLEMNWVSDHINCDLQWH